MISGALERWYFGRWLFTADLFFGIVVTAGAFYGLRGSAHFIADLLDKDGTALYGAFLSALTALLGFAIASVSIIAGLVGSEPFFDLRQDEHYEDFWATFSWSIRFLGIAVLLSLVAIFLNKMPRPQMPMLFATVAIILTCTSSLFRSGLNLELVLAAARKAQKKRERHAATQAMGVPDPTP